MLDTIRWLGHASFRIDGPPTIYIDPWKVGGGPPADLILVTHEHYDHCSPQDVESLSGPGTRVVTVAACRPKLGGDVTVVAPGDTVTVGEVTVEAVPAYNVNKKFHPREAGWVGFVVEVGGVRIYHAGDTDFIPEMRDVRADVMLVPVGGTYTMTADEAVRAVEAVGASIAIPMHCGDIVGSFEDAERFSRLAGGRARVLTPEQ